MTFFRNFIDGRPKEVTVEKDMIISYVKQLFKRDDFPEQIFVALADTIIVNKGDVVWANLDNEHPYDFIPMPRIDSLVVNLCSKEEFLRKIGVERMEDVTPEAEAAFWDEFEFEFADHADGVKLIWI